MRDGLQDSRSNATTDTVPAMVRLEMEKPTIHLITRTVLDGPTVKRSASGAEPAEFITDSQPILYLAELDRFALIENRNRSMPRLCYTHSSMRRQTMTEQVGNSSVRAEFFLSPIDLTG